MTDLWPRYAPLLGRVEKPSRYLGREYGAVDPADKAQADYHAVLIYPDTYEIGQANQAIAILYDDLNSDEHIFCERAYLPWVDMIELMRAEELPMCSLESFAPLSEFDFVGFTLPHEMAATNILECLDLGGIPLCAAERGEDDPIVFGGGPCAYNPEPYARFFDAFFIGEGEGFDREVALKHREMRDAGATREEILCELAKIEGMYVPSMYREKTAEELATPVEGVRDTICTCYAPVEEGIPQIVHKRVIADFNTTKPLPRPIVPYQELVHDRLAVEVLRDIINKGVMEEQIFNAVTSAFSAGWRRCKLYFMIGLPGETDEDVAGIGDLCRRLYAAAKDSVPDDQRGNVRMSASVALFIPKPCTPFQWDGQISLEQIEHRIQVLRDSMPRKGVDLHYHDSQTSYMEAILARGGRECGALIESAWRHGARFDAWSEQFDFSAWEAASKETGIGIFEAATRTFEEGEALPWNHVSCGVTERFLLRERHLAQMGKTTPDCSFGPCTACGVCQDLPVKTMTEKERVL